MSLHINTDEESTDKPKTARRSRISNTTSDTILDAAEYVFSKHGYAGATVKNIAKQADCYESLIYYHYGNKDKLFAAVLKNVYHKLITAERALQLNTDQPEQALAEIVRFMWSYYQKNPELIILLNTENLLKGKHLSNIGSLNEFLSPALEVLQEVVRKGSEMKLFRADIDTTELYTAIMGLGYFYLSNQYTLSAFLSKDLMSQEQRKRWGDVIVQTVLASVKA